MGKFIDLTGQIFGDYEVLYFDNTKGKYKYYWVCKCVNCGAEKSIASSSLKDGKSIRCNNCNEKFHTREIIGYETDLSGLRFGNLTVDSFAYSSNSHSYWNCTCDCGAQVIKSVNALKRGKLKMCPQCAQEVMRSKEYQAAVSRSPYSRKKLNTYEFVEDYVIINGDIFIDKEDLDKINNFDRYIGINCGGYPYITYHNKEVFLHRIILDLPLSFNPDDNLIAEHINGNRKDNRKSNLRICDKSLNPMNCALYSNNTSGHKGISWLSRLQKWQASIQRDGKSYYLGVFSDINDAIKVRDEAEKSLFGEFSRAKEHLYNGPSYDNMEEVI